MYLCPVCSKPFSRKDNMLRHVLQQHGGELQTPVSPYFQFRHPFTMQITAPSMGGKTTWLNTLLTRMNDHVSPVPQRVVYCYSQKQPAYEKIKTMLPDTVEFVKGIPDDIEEEYYFDPRINNMVILDDVMTEAKNDNRIANLFTKGSHHRNLSVVYLTQNLFPQGKASRDIALNCHYLLLFNNPVDRQQIHLLARRIQPTNPERVMKVYEAAVSRPYGNLLIDLKANTSEKDRLVPNILKQEEDEMKAESTDEEMEETEESTDMPENGQRGSGPQYYTQFPPPWYQQRERFKNQEGRGRKRSRFEEETTDHNIWKKLFLPEVIKNIKPKMEKRIEEYVDRGETEDRANVLAFNDNLPEMRKIMMQQFVEYMLNRNALEKDSVYRLIIDTARRLSLEYQMGEIETWKKAAELRIHLMDDILPYKEDI